MKGIKTIYLSSPEKLDSDVKEIYIDTKPSPYLDISEYEDDEFVRISKNDLSRLPAEEGIWIRYENRYSGEVRKGGYLVENLFPDRLVLKFFESAPKGWNVDIDDNRFYIKKEDIERVRELYL